MLTELRIGSSRAKMRQVRSPSQDCSIIVRRYQMHLAASGVGVSTINQTVSTLQFLVTEGGLFIGSRDLIIECTAGGV